MLLKYNLPTNFTFQTRWGSSSDSGVRLGSLPTICSNTLALLEEFPPFLFFLAPPPTPPITLLTAWLVPPSLPFTNSRYAHTHHFFRYLFCFAFLINMTLEILSLITLIQAFFGHFEKNSSLNKLKTQVISYENSSKISEKLKNRQLNLSFYNLKVAFSENVPQAEFFNRSYFRQALLELKTA